MSKVNKEDYLKALEVVKKYNLELIRTKPNLWHKKICTTCSSIVKSAVAGYCQNCWENGFHNEA
jgi:rhamnogalacturonyl hydrolase YesR